MKKTCLLMRKVGVLLLIPRFTVLIFLFQTDHKTMLKLVEGKQVEWGVKENAPSHSNRRQAKLGKCMVL